MCSSGSKPDIWLKCLWCWHSQCQGGVMPQRQDSVFTLTHQHVCAHTLAQTHTHKAVDVRGSSMLAWGGLPHLSSLLSLVQLIQQSVYPSLQGTLLEELYVWVTSCRGGIFKAKLYTCMFIRTYIIIQYMQLDVVCISVYVYVHIRPWLHAYNTWFRYHVD